MNSFTISSFFFSNKYKLRYFLQITLVNSIVSPLYFLWVRFAVTCPIPIPSCTDKKGMQGKREICLFYKSISFRRNVKRNF